jgi:hypothetical protein
MRRKGRRKSALSILHESNGSRFLAEALTAQVKAIFTNETRLMRAEAALAGSLSEFARAGKPHGVVSHVFVKGF